MQSSAIEPSNSENGCLHIICKRQEQTDLELCVSLLEADSVVVVLPEAFDQASLIARSFHLGKLYAVLVESSESAENATEHASTPLPAAFTAISYTQLVDLTVVSRATRSW